MQAIRPPGDSEGSSFAASLAVTRLAAPFGIALSQMSGCVPSFPGEAKASHLPSLENAGCMAFGTPASNGMSW